MTRGEIEELSHTADIGFRVSAPSLPDLFRLAARGLVSALGLPAPEEGVGGEEGEAGEDGEAGKDGEAGRERDRREEGTEGAADAATSVSLRRDDLERLLVAWLRELLRRTRTERAVPRVETLDVTRDGGDRDGGARLEASLRWRPWREGGPDREIKGVTYHGLEVRRDEDGRWHATVVLDV